ncbi:hypothetical protein CUROG_04560 [Corynebacterium urogenitale]|uniref:Uncharacterized protein n=1 Tax=Corynebacterium urogenitale TaxID=2487892 RepID=A0A5J6Z9R9_9CORY|nr:hypothetical protein CUROG_04560 [Corynebacterium urogenitale]
MNNLGYRSQQRVGGRAGTVGSHALGRIHSPFALGSAVGSVRSIVPVGVEELANQLSSAWSSAERGLNRPDHSLSIQRNMIQINLSLS